MSDFVQTMKNWRRMCQQMDKTFGMDSCNHCPLEVCMAVYESDNSENYVEVERKVAKWAAEHPEPVYPTWEEWLIKSGILLRGNRGTWQSLTTKATDPIPADTAQKLGIEPKEADKD